MVIRHNKKIKEMIKSRKKNKHQYPYSYGIYVNNGLTPFKYDIMPFLVDQNFSNRRK